MEIELEGHSGPHTDASKLNQSPAHVIAVTYSGRQWVTLDAFLAKDASDTAFVLLGDDSPCPAAEAVFVEYLDAETFAAINRQRRERERPFVPTGLFLLGYLIVWTVFSVVLASAQWALHGAALLSPMMKSTSPPLGGALLICAGIFQWTPWKRACLNHCRSPLNFLLTGWREGGGQEEEAGGQRTGAAGRVGNGFTN